MDLSLVDTIVVLMLENRSFDHVLGYLSLSPLSRTDVDGINLDLAWQDQFENSFDGEAYAPFDLTDPDKTLIGDPPHERQNIAVQLGTLTAAGTYPMTGFIQSYSTFDPDDDLPLVMGYFTAQALPATDFFVNNYAICDQWFASLPAGTQPNRLMAMSGNSKIDVNQNGTLPEQDLVYDWLDEKKIRWRVYHDGLPFFALMPKWIERITLGEHFKPYNNLRGDMKAEDSATFPQVIFIEPRYTDAPHVEASTDDHAPSPISSGQAYQLRVYNDLASNPDRWKKTVLIITYDEHGGFFDHVTPPLISTNPPTGSNYPSFASLGVRIPTYVISPLVEAGAVFHGVMDHLSVLKFIAEKFNGGTYSAEVDVRPVGSVSAILTRSTPRDDIPHPTANVGFTPDKTPTEPTPQAFSQALETIRKQHPDEAQKRFPELLDKF